MKNLKDPMQYAKVMLFALVALLAPIHTIVVATAVLIIFDTVTGIWAAAKRGDMITSAKFRGVVSKSVIYLIGLIAAFIVEHYMQFDVVPVVKLTAAGIGSTEMLSIIENLNTIAGKNIFDSLKAAIGSQNLPKD